jgi:DNA-binding beta-propeller fold protein YncE
VAIHDGKINVVDSFDGSYTVFDLENRKLTRVKGTGNGSLATPLNITIDEAGNKYIADSAKRQVVVFDANDNFVRAYGEMGQFKPTDVAVVGDRLYVCDIEGSTIQVLDKASGETLFRISGPGTGEGKLGKPTNIDVVNGKLYVSDSIHGRVQEYTLDGDYISVFGSYGTGMGQMARPKGVAVDRDDRVYVVDAAFQNVQIFDKDGELLLFFGGVEGRDMAMLPSTVAIDYDNLKYFEPYVEPNFKLEYVILLVSQYGPNKVLAYGYGKMEGMDYTLPTEGE